MLVVGDLAKFANKKLDYFDISLLKVQNQFILYSTLAILCVQLCHRAHQNYCTQQLTCLSP